jgi:hypothetical protein
MYSKHYMIKLMQTCVLSFYRKIATYHSLQYIVAWIRWLAECQQIPDLAIAVNPCDPHRELRYMVKLMQTWVQWLDEANCLVFRPLANRLQSLLATPLLLPVGAEVHSFAQEFMPSYSFKCDLSQQSINLVSL